MPKGVYIRTHEIKRKPMTEETKRNISLANKGRKLSEEHKLKLSIINKGKKHSIEAKKNMSIAHKNIKLSEEQRRKLSEACKGSKSPNWKGGRSTAERRQYFDINYKLWREAVFDRDLYTCQNCGLSGVYITAHHIKSWKNYPDLRYIVDNGKTLCEDCHKKTDNYKGRAKRNNFI